MQKVKLGHSEIEISVLGLGCMGMSEWYGETNEADNFATLDAAVNAGINFFDSANIYGVGGANEILLGKWLKTKNRKDFIIATKFGLVRDETGEFIGVRGDPEYVRECCEESLKRLGVSYIDLYYQHRVDGSTPIEETVAAMAELVKEGKVRYLGLSEATPDIIRRAHKVHPISALQNEYSLWTTESEPEIIPTCRELGITFVAYSPLGRGFLTGQLKKYEDLAKDDYRRENPRFEGENWNKNMRLVNKIEEIAKEKGVTASQLALAWVLSKSKNDIVPIPGTKRVKYLLENIAATKISITPDEQNRISEILKEFPPVGSRY